MTAAHAFATDDRRNMIAKLHIAKKQLGLDDDTYRANLERLTGKTSSRDMTPAEMETCLKDFSKKGFKAVAKAGKSGLPTTAKINALWLSGWNLGVIRNPSPQAMEAFILRQTGIAKAQWLINPLDAMKVIDGLKAWLAREAKFEWKAKKNVLDFFNWPQVRVCLAQFETLQALGLVHKGHTWTGRERDVSEDLFNYARAVVKGKIVAEFSPQDWLAVQQALGKKIRNAQVAK